ncbi:MAG: hypothetical protein IT331_08195 [Anaerolineae bacterium]|nr:hypothetical protein [Anaerolineae bacterium]
MIPLLEFNELDDFIVHLREKQDTDWTHLEIGHTASERDAQGIRALSFFAIATRRFLAPAPYIVVWSCPIIHTTTLHLQMDKHEAQEHQTRTHLHANFDKVKANLQEHGLCVRPGKWLSQPPEYLR